jgi:hypothetical protein
MLLRGTTASGPERIVRNGIGTLTEAREGFVKGGGATNVVPVGTTSGAREVATGILVLMCPISLLQAMGVVSFTGGRGLLAVTDIDTLFLLASSMAIVGLLVRERHAIGRNIAYVAAVAVLSALLAVLMGYAVTNFGTLFRLRLMVATLIWTLPLALCARGAAAGERPATSRARATMEPLAAGGAP